MRRVLIICCLCAWSIGGLVPIAASQYPRPKPQLHLPTPLGYVSDYAEALSTEWAQRIRAVCKELEQRTGVEMIVVILPKIESNISVQNYASTLYEGWRIGTAQQQHGVLLLASIKEQKAVVVLGRSLLSVVTRQQLDELSAEYLVPMFQQHELDTYLYQSTVRLASAVGKVQFLGNVQKKPSTVSFWMNLSVVFVMMYVLWRFTRPERRHPFQRWRRGEYWSIGQGGFGGNFGGFGGRIND